jgi:hypothetical protein
LKNAQKESILKAKKEEFMKTFLALMFLSKSVLAWGAGGVSRHQISFLFPGM